MAADVVFALQARPYEPITLRGLLLRLLHEARQKTLIEDDAVYATLLAMVQSVAVPDLVCCSPAIALGAQLIRLDVDDDESDSLHVALEFRMPCYNHPTYRCPHTPSSTSSCRCTLLWMPWPASVQRPPVEQFGGAYHDIHLFTKHHTQPRRTRCYGHVYNYSSLKHPVEPQTPETINALMHATNRIFRLPDGKGASAR